MRGYWTFLLGRKSWKIKCRFTKISRFLALIRAIRLFAALDFGALARATDDLDSLTGSGSITTVPEEQSGKSTGIAANSLAQKLLCSAFNDTTDVLV